MSSSVPSAEMAQRIVQNMAASQTRQVTHGNRFIFPVKVNGTMAGGGPGWKGLSDAGVIFNTLPCSVLHGDPQ